MKCIIVHHAKTPNPGDSTHSIRTPLDRPRTPKAPPPRAFPAPGALDSLVAALGDQLLAVWFEENAPKLRLPLLTSRSEPGNTPAPKGGTRETRI